VEAVRIYAGSTDNLMLQKKLHLGSADVGKTGKRKRSRQTGDFLGLSALKSTGYPEPPPAGEQISTRA
jgi:hypothetical protein